jgi:hypothetical protein
MFFVCGGVVVCGGCVDLSVVNSWFVVLLGEKGVYGWYVVIWGGSLILGVMVWGLGRKVNEVV